MPLKSIEPTGGSGLKSWGVYLVAALERVRRSDMIHMPVVDQVPGRIDLTGAAQLRELVSNENCAQQMCSR
jgi:hypothetical protein